MTVRPVNWTIRAVPPAWPLSANVAVNPFLGQSGAPLELAQARLRRVGGTRITPEHDDLLLDVMLGKLASYLRMCGYDAVYALDEGLEADDAVQRRAAADARRLLTRDEALAGGVAAAHMNVPVAHVHGGDAMEGAMAAGLDVTATIMYGHVENEAHRARHLDRIRDLQDRTGAITEFVPLSFVHHETPLHERGLVEAGATAHEDELMIAVSRLYLDNVEHIQSSWVKYGDAQGLKMLTCGADDFMGTILSEEITKRAGGDYGEFRSVREYADMIASIGRVPVERSTDYEKRRRIDPDAGTLGPTLGPRADGTPLL